MNSGAAMVDMMQAIVWDGGQYPDSLTYREWDIPEPEPGWVLVRNRVCGICGSDVHYLLGQGRSLFPERNLPTILGHETAGTVVKVGAGVTSVKPGDRVAVEPLHGCMQFGGSCPMCRIGKYNLCKSGLSIIGVPLGRPLRGGYGEYSVAHETRLFQIPANVTLEDAALLDILACDVHAVKIGHPSMGDTAVVLGCGIIGLDMIQCLRAEGVTEIVAVAKYEFQAAMARTLGARETIVTGDGATAVAGVLQLTGGWGVDQVYECVGGETDSMDQSVAMCHKGGTAIMLGLFPTGPRPFNLRALMRKEVNLLTSNTYSTAGIVREYQIALNLLRDGQVDHRCLVTHRFAPEDFRAALDVTMAKGQHNNIKTVFVRD